MLISFHEPDNERNQVLYCRLGNGDKELVNRFVRKYISSLYPPKTFVYKGEEIIIYPMADGDFLACYLTSDFMALSFQEKTELKTLLMHIRVTNHWRMIRPLQECVLRKKV